MGWMARFEGCIMHFVMLQCSSHPNCRHHHLDVLNLVCRGEQLAKCNLDLNQCMQAGCRDLMKKGDIGLGTMMLPSLVEASEHKSRLLESKKSGQTSRWLD